MPNRHATSDVDGAPDIESPRKLFRFDPRIDSGNILTILVLVAGMATGYSKIEKSIALNEQRTAQIEVRAAEQETRTNQTLNTLQSDVKATGQQVQDLKAKIDLLDLKVTQPRSGR
jgi:hypothetical protein